MKYTLSTKVAKWIQDRCDEWVDPKEIQDLIAKILQCPPDEYDDCSNIDEVIKNYEELLKEE